MENEKTKCFSNFNGGVLTMEGFRPDIRGFKVPTPVKKTVKPVKTAVVSSAASTAQSSLVTAAVIQRSFQGGAGVTKPVGLVVGSIGTAALAVSGGFLIALGVATVRINEQQLMALTKDMSKPINTMNLKKSLAIWNVHLKDQKGPIFSKKEMSVLAQSFVDQLKTVGVLDSNGQINKKDLLASQKTPTQIQDGVKDKIKEAASKVLILIQTENGESISQDRDDVKAMIDNITSQTLQEFGWPDVHLEIETQSTGRAVIKDLLSESNMLTGGLGRFKESPVKTAKTKLENTISKWVDAANSVEPASADEALKKLNMAGLTAKSTPTQINAVVTTIMHAIGMHDPEKLQEAARIFTAKAGVSGTERLEQQLKTHGMLDHNGMVKSTGSPEDMASIFGKMSTSNPTDQATIIKDILSETGPEFDTFKTFKETLSDAMGKGSKLGVKKDRYTTDNIFSMGKAVSGMVAGGGFMSGGAAALVPLCGVAAGLAGPISLIIAASAGCVLATMGAVQDLSQMKALNGQLDVVSIALDVVQEKLNGITATIEGLQVKENSLTELEKTQLTQAKEEVLPTQIKTTKLTIKQKLLKIKAEIKKLSAIKQILYAVGAALALAGCAIAIAGTFGAAAIPLAILGGVAGASILSGVGIQVAQNKLGNPEKEEEGKQAALADLEQFKKDFDIISKQVKDGSLSGTDLNAALKPIIDNLKESKLVISNILQKGGEDLGFTPILDSLRDMLNAFSIQNKLDMLLGDSVLGNKSAEGPRVMSGNGVPHMSREEGLHRIADSTDPISTQLFNDVVPINKQKDLNTFMAFVTVACRDHDKKEILADRLITKYFEKANRELHSPDNTTPLITRLKEMNQHIQDISLILKGNWVYLPPKPELAQTFASICKDTIEMGLNAIEKSSKPEQGELRIMLSNMRDLVFEHTSTLPNQIPIENLPEKGESCWVHQVDPATFENGAIQIQSLDEGKVQVSGQLTLEARQNLDRLAPFLSSRNGVKVEKEGGRRGLGLPVLVGPSGKQTAIGESMSIAIKDIGTIRFGRSKDQFDTYTQFQFIPSPTGSFSVSQKAQHAFSLLGMPDALIQENAYKKIDSKMARAIDAASPRREGVVRGHHSEALAAYIKLSDEDQSQVSDFMDEMKREPIVKDGLTEWVIPSLSRDFTENSGVCLAHIMGGKGVLDTVVQVLKPDGSILSHMQQKKLGIGAGTFDSKRGHLGSTDSVFTRALTDAHFENEMDISKMLNLRGKRVMLLIKPEVIHRPATLFKKHAWGTRNPAAVIRNPKENLVDTIRGAGGIVDLVKQKSGSGATTSTSIKRVFTGLSAEHIQRQKQTVGEHLSFLTRFYSEKERNKGRIPLAGEITLNHSISQTQIYGVVVGSEEEKSDLITRLNTEGVTTLNGHPLNNCILVADQGHLRGDMRDQLRQL